MFLFRSFFSFFLAFMKQKRLQKEKKKCRKYRHCRICQCLPLSGAAKKEYKINIAIEWRTEICCSMGPNNLWSWILNFSSNQFYNNTWSHLLSDKIPSRVDESQRKYFIFVIFNFSEWNFVCRSDGFWILLHFQSELYSQRQLCTSLGVVHKLSLQVVVQKCCLFVNVHKVDNVNGGG